MPDGAYVPSEAFKKASTADKIAFLSSKSPSFAKAAPADQAAYINHLLGNDVQTDFEKRNAMPDNERQANEFLLGTASGASGLPETLHPLDDAAKAQPQSLGDAAISGLKQAALGPLPGIAKKAYDVGSELLSPQQSGESDEDVAERRSHALGTAAGNVLPMMAGDIKEGVNDTFAESPNVAAQRALRPPAKQAQSFQKSLPNAQAYLKGASSLEDLQSRIPDAKNEIWKPYTDALNNIGSQAVNGPDGPTTYADLEKARQETSAQLHSTRRLIPSDQQTMLQKNQSVKDLTDRYNAILGPLDEGLQSQGIDPKGIRNTFGDVQQINRLSDGRNTLSQPDQRYGFGRMAKDASIFHPLDSLGGVVAGTKDLLAGRPLWSGKPTDVMVKEGFRSGPEKPDLGTPTPAAPPTMPAVPIPPPDLPSSDSPTSFRTGTPASASYSPSASQPDRNVIEMSPTLPPPTMPAVPSGGGGVAPPTGPQEGASLSPATQATPSPFQASQLIRKPVLRPPDQQ